jgi:hypothetical protein
MALISFANFNGFAISSMNDIAEAERLVGKESIVSILKKPQKNVIHTTSTDHSMSNIKMARRETHSLEPS